MKGSSAQIDVVIVPDFSGPKSLVFETRALFFLASWLAVYGEGGAKTTGFRLHVCCIGEPPASVRRLAARAGAGVSVHEPLLLDYGGFANKLRGLEAPGERQRILLLDADVLVMGPLDALAAITADAAAAPAGKPQVPEAQWRFIYDGLAIPLPTERIASAHGECEARLDAVAHRYRGQDAEAAAMLPYYNSGVLLARRDGGLRGLWEDHLRRIPALFSPPGGETPAHAVTHGDQVALATALQALRGQGGTLGSLSGAFNARLVHFRKGALRVGETRLLHAAGFAGFLQTRDEMYYAVENYEARWGDAIREGLRDRPQDCAFDLEKARSWLWSLWECWVRDA